MTDREKYFAGRKKMAVVFVTWYMNVDLVVDDLDESVKLSR